MWVPGWWPGRWDVLGTSIPHIPKQWRRSHTNTCGGRLSAAWHEKELWCVNSGIIASEQQEQQEKSLCVVNFRGQRAKKCSKNCSAVYCVNTMSVLGIIKWCSLMWSSSFKSADSFLRFLFSHFNLPLILLGWPQLCLDAAIMFSGSHSRACDGQSLFFFYLNECQAGSLRLMIKD